MRHASGDRRRSLNEPYLRHQLAASPASRQPSRRRPSASIGPYGATPDATATRGGQPLEVERGLQDSSFRVSGLHLRPAAEGVPRGRGADPVAGPPLPERAPAGHSGAGHSHPHGSVPHVTSDESGDPAECRGARRRGGRTARGSGNLEIWNPESLRDCGARQVFRF